MYVFITNGPYSMDGTFKFCAQYWHIYLKRAHFQMTV